jgi:hypothetical protein
MTIAAGFFCHDGVVVCADSEISHTTNKSEGTKLNWLRTLKTVRVITSAAGSVPLFKLVHQTLRSRLKEGMSLDGVKQLIESVITEVHDRHVYPYASDPDRRPWLRMVFGVWVHGEGAALYHSEWTVVLEETQVEVMGVGAEFGMGVLPRWWISGSKATCEQAIFASIGLLNAVKANVQGCGGKSDIIAMDAATGTIAPMLSMDQREIEQVHNRLELALGAPMLQAIANINLDESKFLKTVDLMTKLLKETRAQDVLKDFRAKFNRPNPA